jgi:drug/metabolite transporter (DMT)-like permease
LIAALHTGTLRMAPTRIVALTSLAMLAFAGNSLLCRLALKHTGIDAASFTSVRLASGALVLWLLVALRRRAQAGAQTGTLAGSWVGRGNWLSALALFVYALAFSLAYVNLSAATGALLLFGAVQATMIARGLWSGERMRALQWAGFLLALGGLVGLLLPGLTAPPLASAAWMLAAGVAWGVYSLRGKGAGDPTLVTAGNFMRTVPMAAVVSAVMLLGAAFGSNGLAGAGWLMPAVDSAGLAYALASGAITSGLGYAIWYTALPALRATTAATVQLSVPAIAAFGGVLLLGESLSPRLGLASLAILGGIALVILSGRQGR